jgi:hypothetical protein
MAMDEKSRKVFWRWSWPAFILAVLLIVSTGEGLLSLLARIENDHPTVYAWLDLFVTFVPFLLFVGLGLKTPAEQVRERIDKLKQQFRMN